MGSYQARRVDLETLQTVADIYKLHARADALAAEACGPGAVGPGLDPGAMVTRLRELGLHPVLCSADPAEPPAEIVRATVQGWVFLARVKGIGGEDAPVWGIAEWRDGAGVGIILQVPTEMPMFIPAPFSEVWTGLGIVIRKDHGYGMLT